VCVCVVGVEPTKHPLGTPLFFFTFSRNDNADVI